MMIGIQTNTWPFDLHRQDLRRILREAAEAGYEGVEIGANRLDLERPSELREFLDAHGLRLLSLHLRGDLYTPAWLEDLDAIELALDYALSTDAIFISLSGRPCPDPSAEALRRTAESVARTGRLCRDRGMTLCYHNHDWEIADERRELLWLRDHTDPKEVAFVVDIGWIVHAGADPATVLGDLGPRVAYYHLKDLTAAGDWIELGDGIIDLRGFLGHIDPSFSGWLVVERDVTQSDPLASARRSRSHLRDLLGR